MSNSDQMQLAVNHALSDYQMIRRREQLMMSNFANAASANPGLDAKRSSSWCEFGYPGHLNFIDFFKLYTRVGIASGGVSKLADRCWSTQPQVIEGEKQDKDKKETAWEKSLAPVLRQGRLWRDFKDADIRRLVGRYSAIILKIRDNKPWNEPVTKGRGLQGLQVAWAGSIWPESFNSDLNSSEYGNVKLWRYREPSVSGQPVREVDIHPDRVFILGSWQADAIGFLEPVFNNFVNLEKTEGGSGESILKNSNRSIHVNFDGTVDLRNLAALYGVSVSELQTRFNDVAREVNQGNDILFVTQGATATPLVASVPDPSPTYNINLQSVSAGLDIPSKILVGNQTGERASTEDEAYMNRRCQGRRTNDISFEIHDFFAKLQALRVIEPISEFSVVFDDLTESTLGEKLDNATKMVAMNASTIGSGQGQEIFAREQILGAVGMEDMVDLSTQPPLADKDEEEEDEDGQS